MRRRLTLLLLAVVSAACAQAIAVQARPVVLAGASRRPLFEVHTDAFWMNLHHFLYLQSRGRRGIDMDRTTVRAAVADTVGLGALPDSLRRGWARALDHYGRVVAARSLVFDGELTTIKARLAAAESAPSPAGSGLDSALVGALHAAAPAFRALQWRRHESANNAAVAALVPLVRTYGDSLAARLTRAFRQPWPAEPIRVDMVAYANWSGAYTTERPSHITYSSITEDLEGSQGLEILFHEALHTMEDSVTRALNTAGRTAGKRPPADLVHTLIFYSAGEITRRLVPGHVPYAERGIVGAKPDDGAAAARSCRSTGSRISRGEYRSTMRSAH